MPTAIEKGIRAPGVFVKFSNRDLHSSMQHVSRLVMYLLHYLDMIYLQETDVVLEFSSHTLMVQGSTKFILLVLYRG